MSLRRVAAALETGAASLYVYVANLEELHAFMLDQALAAVPLSGPRGRSWRGRLKALLRAYLDALYERRGLAQIALSTIAAGPSSLRIWEVLLSLPEEGGVDDSKAAWGVELLILYVTAIAAEQSLRREGYESLQRVRKVLSTASEEEFPRVFALNEALLSGDGGSRNEWALDVIIDGIAGGRMQPARAAAARPRGVRRKH